ncbi:MAG: hypothetical protein ACRD04_02870 [Terriglobales bacterium]
MPFSIRRAATVTAAAMLIFTAGAWASRKATYIRPVMHTFSAAGIRQIVVQNLAGPISVQTAAGNSIQVTILIHSAGDDAVFARTLSQQLTFTVQNINGQLRVIGNYPLDHFRNYAYPMKSIAGIHGTDKNVYQGKKVFVRNVSSGKAVELWAEIRITTPPRVAVVLRNIYGELKLRGGVPAPGGGSMDGFTDAGNIEVYRPEWQSVKLQNDYGKVDFTAGLGAARDIHIKTDVGSTYLSLQPGADPVIIAHKDLGFLHNDITQASFHKDSQGDSVLKLGDGKGATVTIDMSIGSLHLATIGAGQ